MHKGHFFEETNGKLTIYDVNIGSMGYSKRVVRVPVLTIETDKWSYEQNKRTAERLCMFLGMMPLFDTLDFAARAVENFLASHAFMFVVDSETNEITDYTVRRKSLYE